LAFGIALDAIPDPARRRRVPVALEIAADRVAGDRHAAGISEQLQIAAQVVVEQFEPRAIAREQNLAADVRSLDRARIADELPQVDGAVDSRAGDRDEVGSACVEAAANAGVACDQRSAGKQRDVASDVGSGEHAARRHVDVAAHARVAETFVAVEILCSDSSAEC